MYYKQIWIHIITLYIVIALLITTEIVFSGPERQFIITLGTCFFVMWLTSFWELVHLFLGSHVSLKQPEDILHEKIEIQLADGVVARGHILKSQKMDLNRHNPAIILHHGVGSKKENLYHLGYPLARRGFIILAVDARGHGETGKNFRQSRKDDWYLSENTGIFKDFTQWVNFLITRPDVDPNQITVIGHSLGGAVCLSTALLDARVKLCILLSPLYSFEDFLQEPQGRKFLGETWMQKMVLHFSLSFSRIRKMESLILPKYIINTINPRDVQNKVRLIHSRDDELLLFGTHAIPIQTRLQLPFEYVFFPREGGHHLRGQEAVIMERILSWIYEFYGKSEIKNKINLN